MGLIRRLKDIYWAIRASNFRGFMLMMRHRNFQYPILVRKHCVFRNLKYAKAGKHLVISDYAELFINPERGKKAELIIGNNVSIGRFSSIGCANKIVIEDEVTLAPHVHITDRNHGYEDIKTPIWRQPTVCPGPIVIGRESWLGYGVQVMPGVTIGRHCVIAAGSVVTKDIPDYSVAAGIPAKVIKQYNDRTCRWDKGRRSTDAEIYQGGDKLLIAC